MKSSTSQRHPFPHRSIHLNRAINPPHKRIRRQKADGAHQQSVNRAGQQRVREEEQIAHEAGEVQRVDVVVDAVREDPCG